MLNIGRYYDAKWKWHPLTVMLLLVFCTFFLGVFFTFPDKITFFPDPPGPFFCPIFVLRL